jgi:small subunit ribosomal protein S18
MRNDSRNFDDDRSFGDDRRGGGDGDPLGFKRGRGKRKKAPSFVLEEGFSFDYKNPQQLKFFITERGKIVPRRISGLNAKQQRDLTFAIKRARNIALMPYTAME